VANAIWKQDCLLKKIEDGQIYLGYFYGLIDSGKIVVMYPNENLTHESYLVAKGNNIAMYDSIFICLAVKLGLNLKTLDNKQAEIFGNLNRKQSRVQ
jgi:predicted nucleic acid-binding protein